MWESDPHGQTIFLLAGLRSGIQIHDKQNKAEAELCQAKVIEIVLAVIKLNHMAQAY